MEGQRSESKSRRSQDAGEGRPTGSSWSISRILRSADQCKWLVINGLMLWCSLVGNARERKLRSGIYFQRIGNHSVSCGYADFVGDSVCQLDSLQVERIGVLVKFATIGDGMSSNETRICDSESTCYHPSL
jgi:hypothetical protein